MTEAGHSFAHLPQPTHCSSLTAARIPRQIWMADSGHTFTQQPQATLDVHQDSILEGYHILHDKAGVKRRKNVPSSENLIKMLLKHQSIPFINQVVDIYNVISMESRLCVAAHNMDKIDGNLTVRFSDGTETYLPLGPSSQFP